MVKNSGDTQARFLAKSLAIFSGQSAVSIQPKKDLPQRTRRAQRNTQEKEVAADLRKMNADTNPDEERFLKT
jgi:hypothetical protein